MAAPPPVLTLAVDKGPRKGETRQCRAGTVLRIGRVVKGNDLAVRDVGASQQHLAIEFLPPPAARWAVSDLASSNGSLLNDAPLVPSVPASLSHGDVIKIGESTVLTVSISSDSDPNPGATAKPGLRRSSRQVAASVVVEEGKLLAVTGRGTRKKALAAAAAAAAPEIPEAVNEEPDAAAPVLEEEKSRAVTHQGGRKKAASAEPQEKMEEAAEAPRRGGRKKAGEPPQPKKDEEEEPAVVGPRGRRKKAAEPPEPEREEEDKEEEAPVVTRRGRRKKAAELPEPEREENKEEAAPVVMRRGGRKKDVAIVDPPPLPPGTRSTRYPGRSTKQAVLEDEIMEEQEQNKKDVDKKAVPSEPTGKPSTSTTVMGSEEGKGGKVAAGHGEVEIIAAFDEELFKGRASSQLAASDNVGDEEKGSREEEENGKGALVGSGGVVADREKVQGCAQRSSLETMTLRDWFERMEKYLPRMIDEAADEMIANLEKRHQHILEYISTIQD